MNKLFAVSVPLRPKKKYLSFFPLALCGGEKCNECNSSYSTCTQCLDGYLLVRDEFNLDDHCIEHCPNITIQ